MNYNFGNIPFIQILEFLAVGVGLLVVFNFIGRYIIPLISDRTPFANVWWQRIKIISWSAFLLLFYSTLLRSYPSMTIIFTIIVLGLSWEHWKNVFSGVLIKVGSHLNVGDLISTENVKGTLKKIDLSRSELVNDKGELILVPNNELRNRIVTHLRKTHDANICIFNVKTTSDQTLDDIYNMAYNCPYIAVNQDISVKRNENDTCVVKATIVDDSFIDSANRYFEKAVAGEKSVH